MNKQRISEETEKMLRETKCLLKGHFVLTTAAALAAEKKPTPAGDGDHSDGYVDKDIVNKFGWTIERIGMFMAMIFYDRGLKPDVIACPAIGAISLRDVVWRNMEILTGKEIIRGFSEKIGGVQVLKRANFTGDVKDKKVITVEDITTTGTSVGSLNTAVIEAGGTIIGSSAIVARGDVTAETLGIDFFHALWEIRGIQKWPATGENGCPLCKENIPVDENVAHGRDFLAKQKS